MTSSNEGGLPGEEAPTVDTTDHGRSDQDHRRLEQIFETLLSFAKLDFENPAPLSGTGDTIDAIAQGLNMLAEELRGEVASCKELEDAYRNLREVQAKVSHAGKLAAVGQLASGIAHEINNPATAVSMTLALSQRRLKHVRQTHELAPDALESIDEVLSHLADAGAALERIRTVTSDLRTFSRADADLRELHSLNDTIEVACRLAAPTLSAGAELILDLGDIPPIYASRARVAQVVTNLVVNAAQAIEMSERVQGAGHEIAVITRQAPGGVLLAVEDSGPGIAVQNREKIFEPFFTTKHGDAGLGLGLALVADIVKADGGHVLGTEGSRCGARIEVFLPAANLPSENNDEERVSENVRNLEVLLIDDEQILLASLGAWLREEYECRVSTARGGQEALEILRERRDFDLVLCDLHMPHTDGIAVYQWLNDNATKVCKQFAFLSGGILTAKAQRFLDQSSAPMLPKPFREDELHGLLNEMAKLRTR